VEIGLFPLTLGCGKSHVINERVLETRMNTGFCASRTARHAVPLSVSFHREVLWSGGQTPATPGGPMGAQKEKNTWQLD
jgi:hypothetical protein